MACVYFVYCHHGLDEEEHDDGVAAEPAVLPLQGQCLGRLINMCRWALLGGLLVYPIPCLWVVVRNALCGGVSNSVNIILCLHQYRFGGTVGDSVSE